MKKITKLAVFSAISTATIWAPLSTTLAGAKSIYDEEITKKIEDVKRKMDVHFPSHDFSIRSHNYSARSVLEKHHPYYPSSNHHHRHVDHKRKEQNHYHVERKIHRHVERKMTTHRHIHEHHVTRHNSGDALAAGIIGLAAGTILSNVLKKSEQPKIIYQTMPQSRVVYQEVPQGVYQQVPQNQVIYEVQSTATYQPLQQPWTDAWLQYCKKKYRSFNPKTGTFRGYDGLEHFCYAPLN
ncbi:BA14K family protein [Bartonella senegalensis]|uniref:BA14K family protein n=1 Tax=Bartonella senegalensis TaxID=1468418 RepID=UPI0002E355BD|nr:BA14K family protein [Bartonella senegalensis]